MPGRLERRHGTADNSKWVAVNAGREKASRHRQLWLVPSQGEVSHHLTADVAVNVASYQLRTYAVPPTLEGRVTPGAAVRVPVGRSERVVDGLCVRVTERAWDQTRPPVLDAEPAPPWFSDELAALGLWVSEYYVCSPWKTFSALLPATLRARRERQVVYLRRTETSLPRKPTPKQAALLDVLGTTETRRDEALRQAGVTTAVLGTLCKHGVVETVVRREAVPRVAMTSAAAAPSPEDDFALTSDQQAAVKQIRATMGMATGTPTAFRVFLLFGVPGSGKTEVYVRVMREVVRAGRQAILLIPEIALATQIVDRLARRFERVAVLHSQLPRRARQDSLAAIAAGEVDVVIGTRTAVFAPCPRLGLIVVDEEQETSFKNLAAPFYHARDVAIKRGQLQDIPVVLGSATPALETWHNARHRTHYQLLRLSERVPGAKLPDARAVPTAARSDAREAPVLSAALREELRHTLEAGQQAILLHNRRGYAVHLRCENCGLIASCERCGGPLVFHQTGPVLKCHRCGWRREPVTRCLDNTCNGPMQRVGLAIQRLEEELREVFPAARLLRLDSDTMRHREHYRSALASFEAGEADILIGTQMVAKGLDFPRVRVVGVVSADATLSMPDFRAAERTFQLIVQTVGRAGRREGAAVALVQTTGSPAPVIQQAVDLQFEPFAEGELAVRQQFFYPPFARLARLVCADARPNRARDAAEALADTLRERASRVHAELRVERAGPCVIRRLRDLLRYEVLVRGPRGTAVHTLLRQAADENLLRPAVQRLTVDVDPVDLL